MENKNNRNAQKSTEGLQISTKEHMANSASRSRSQPYHLMSIKARHSMARRRNKPKKTIQPIYYKIETKLSPMYRKDINQKYLYQVFDSFDLVGKGSFGNVYKAQSKEDKQSYAIKISNGTHTCMNYEEVALFEKFVNCEYVVKFYFAWEESHRLYLQLELCATSLDKYILVYHHVIERKCWEILVDVSRGLKYLHNRNYIHLDIKPANIMITEKGRCKIGDFGLVRSLAESQNDTPKRKASQGLSEGDSKYVAIEILRDRKYTKAGDIFSLGIMMLEIASDVELPSFGVEWVLLRSGSVPHCYRKRNLSARFCDLVRQMMHQDYSQRPTIEQVLAHPGCYSTALWEIIETRTNIMATWRRDFADYLVSNPLPSSTSMALLEQGASPPTRARNHPIRRLRNGKEIDIPLEENSPPNNNRNRRKKRVLQHPVRCLFP